MRKTATSAPVTEPARDAGLTPERDPAAVLADLRELRAVSLAAEAASLQQAAVWADLHPVGEDEPGATFHERATTRVCG